MPAEYAAIAFDSVYAIATPSFWHLHPQELLVLQMILQAVPESSTLAQIPVHLPHTAGDRSSYVLMVTLTTGRSTVFCLGVKTWHVACEQRNCAPIQLCLSFQCNPEDAFGICFWPNLYA